MSAVSDNKGWLTNLGEGALRVGQDVRGILALGRAAAASLRRLEAGETFRQTYELCNRSAFFVIAIMGFTGAIMIVQGCAQAMRIIGDLTMIGPGFLQLLVREFGPTIGAMMIAARYGAGVAAELGAMTITEQVDALRMAGADAPGYLVAPRVVGGAVGMLPVVVVGSFAAHLAGALAGHHGFDISYSTYFGLQLLNGSDLVTGVLKSLAYGVAVPLVSCHAGLTAFGGAPGVGQATTRAVIGSSLAVLFLDLVIGGVAYLLFPYSIIPGT